MTKSDIKTVILLTLVMFTSGANLLVMTPILPQVARELHVSIEQAGLWITAFASATAVFALIFGPISDRYGRRIVLLIGMLTLGLGSLASSYAIDFLSMTTARALAGAGTGLLVTSTTSFVGDHFDEDHRAIAMGYVMGGFFVALILAVPLGAFLTALLGWNQMFLLLSIFGAVLFVIVALSLPSPKSTFRIQALSPMSALRGYLSLLLDRKVLGIALMSLSIGMSMTMFSVYSSPWLQQAYGLNTTERGLIYAVGGPAVILGGPVAGRLSNRFGRVALIVVGSIVMGLLQIAMPYSNIGAEPAQRFLEQAGWQTFYFGRVMWPVVLPTLTLFFLALLSGSARSAPFQTLALEVVPPNRRGALSALRNTFNQGGAAFGAALGAAVWGGAKGGYAVICIVASVVTLAGVVALRILVGSDRRRSRP